MTEVFSKVFAIKRRFCTMIVTYIVSRVFSSITFRNSTTDLPWEKARNWDRDRHASWLRILCYKAGTNVLYVVTGDALN
ncbi:MAG: hypothetical protein HDR88_07450 [Bacteroides sp.]|nr:hypothetical protein [Bacteroides sp.]